MLILLEFKQNINVKKNILILGISIILASCGSKISTNDLATQTPIHSFIDLTKVANDKVPVTINPGRFVNDTVVYRIPRVVQGTYSVSDFGKYIDDLKAIDYNGNELPVSKTDTNTWTITSGNSLDKITYWVNDTFDQETRGGLGEEEPFSPAGTNIEPNNYVLNLHGFIGYFDSLKNNQYAIAISSPATFVRTASLEATKTETSNDGTVVTTSYFAPRYFDVTDNPMMYGDLDVEEFNVGDIKIVLSVYSPNKAHSALSLKETIYDMMKAQKQYLGDINSTPRYDIYLYLSDGTDDAPKGFGALEHHKSTVVVMSEAESKEGLAASMVDLVAHEFFHIVSPLSVHSEDVHYFDYNNPSFSKHLWMYEGVTEYFAQHFQVYEKLIPNKAFYRSMDQKITLSKNFDDTMSFTHMSENILDEPYARDYLNVYNKGALIGMCIDILMRAESNGQRSMLSLMKELSNKYGVNKPFEDDSLIKEITAMTYPSVGEFLTKHVEGNLPIDYSKYLDKVGVMFAKKKIETNYIQTGRGFIFRANPNTQTLFFTADALDNSFWKEQGIQSGDIVKSVNGKLFTLETGRAIIDDMFTWQAGDDVELVINRDGKDITIKTKLTPTFTTLESIADNPNASPEQIATRKAWLNL